MADKGDGQNVAWNNVTIRFAQVQTPDTKYVDNGAYYVDVSLDDRDDIVQELRAYEKETAAGLGWKKFKSAVRENSDGGLSVKMKRKSHKGPPTVVDAKLNPTKVEVRGGDICNLRGFLGSYDTKGNRGFTVYLNAVQIVQKNSKPDRGISGSSGFSVVDGFVSDDDLNDTKETASVVVSLDDDDLDVPF